MNSLANRVLEFDQSNPPNLESGHFFDNELSERDKFVFEWICKNHASYMEQSEVFVPEGIDAFSLEFTNINIRHLPRKGGARFYICGLLQERGEDSNMIISISIKKEAGSFQVSSSDITRVNGVSATERLTLDETGSVILAE